MLYYTGNAQNLGETNLDSNYANVPITCICHFLCALRSFPCSALYLKILKICKLQPGKIHGCGGRLEGRRFLSPFCCRLTPLVTSLSRPLWTTLSNKVPDGQQLGSVYAVTSFLMVATFFCCYSWGCTLSGFLARCTLC